MLKDSRSYEVQIIDAVRSVNRALGGTYGTSSAIGKTEFNQYEVQLIDAIKGIGRTLSGKGLSLAGGAGVGDLSGYATAAQFQDLSRRVTILENESFFRLVDGNVTLKEQYQNLWVPGWLAAGGIGTSGGGGGVSSLCELDDVYHTSGSGVLRADGTDAVPGDSLVYNTTLGWVAAPVSGGGGSGTVTGVKMNGTTLSPSTTGIVDLGTVITSLSGYATEQWVGQQGFLTASALSGYATQTWVQQQGYLTSYTETDPTVPAWAKAQTPSLYVGTTQVQTSSAAQDLTGILSVKATSSILSKFIWDGNNDAWHFLGNLYADGWVSAGGVGTSGGGGGGGIDLTDVWASLTNSVQDAYENTKINIAHIPSITTSYISNLETWIAGKGYISSESDPTVPAWAKNQNPLLYIGYTSVQTSAQQQYLFGIPYINATNVASSPSRIIWDSVNNAWHFYGNVYADGWVSAGGIGNAGSGGSVVSIDNLLSSGTRIATLTIDGDDYDILAPAGGAGTVSSIKVGTTSYNPVNGVVSLPAYPTTLPASDVYAWAKTSSKPSYTFSELTSHPTTIPGYGITDAKIANGVITLGSDTITPLTSHQTIYKLTLNAGSFTAGEYTPNSAAKTFNIPTSLDHITDGTNRKLSDYVTLGTTQTITGAKTFTTNPLTIGQTSSLSVHQSSHIDIGPLRIEYDATNKALHITKASSSDTNTYGIYADGFVSAGGIQ